MTSDLVGKFRGLLRDTGGSTAVIFGICAIPTIMMLGMALDYGIGVSNKTKLDAAADAASMVAVTTATSIINAQNGSFTSPINAFSAGQAQALIAFKANAGSVAFSTVPTPTATVTNPIGQTITATVSYTTPMNNQFGRIIGVPTSTLGGTSTSSMTIGSYLDFYLMVDMSGSMGLPTSSADQQTLAGINPDNKSSYPTGCVFACHMTDKLCTNPTTGAAQQCQGFTLSRNNNLVLRVDSVTSAVCQFLQAAIAAETLSNQFRVGIYPFIQNAAEFYPTSTTAPTSTNLVGAEAAVGCTANTYLYAGPQAVPIVPPLTNLLDTGTSSTYGSGGTHFENALPFLQSKISPIGKGANSAQAAPYLFIITDGMQNSQTYQSVGNWYGGSSPQPMNYSLCSSLKSSGVTISILYIPYLPINPANASFAGNEDGLANDAINLTSPNVSNSLQSCASNGYFHSATSSAAITAALQQMLTQALQAAHLTQ